MTAGTRNRSIDTEPNFLIDWDLCHTHSGTEEVLPPVVDEAPVGGPKQRSARQATVHDYSGRDRLVLEHVPLVKSIATRMRGSLPAHVDVEDLTNAGILGLIDAASKFDAEQHVSFSNYAKYRIKGAIIDSLRKLDGASRDVRRRERQISVATEELTGELGRVPSEAETAERLGMSVDRLRQTKVDAQHAAVVSADTHASEADDLPAMQFAADEQTQPDVMCSHARMNEVLAGAMTCLRPRYRQVVTMYYSNEMTMKEISIALGINESRVSQIHKAALEKMNAALRAGGIHSSAAL